MAQGEDCNDGDPSVYPGAAERCDGVDNDCDGAADPNVVPTEYASVQDAVDDVADGSLVCLLPGTYEETVDVSGRSLSIEGIGGSGAVIFDVSGVLGLDRPIFRANEARLTLRGIGVSGGAQLVGSAAEVPLIIDA